MYIRKIQLSDVRCFEYAEIDLSESKPGTSVLIAGNNGIGKSAILRAIAMGLCDRDSAASLLRELEGNFIRRTARSRRSKKGDKQATIEIDLVDDKGHIWSLKTTVAEWEDLQIERVEQSYRNSSGTLDFKTFSSFWNKLFVTGYGAGLRTTANAKFSEYFHPDALYSLFKYDAPLQDPEVAWRRLIAVPGRAGRPQARSNHISRLLHYVLDLESTSRIKLEGNGIFVTRGHERIPLDALGDGHKSLVKITLDIIVWYLLKNNDDRLQMGEQRPWRQVPISSSGVPSIRGIVVVDEIEQHLHPKLQRQILMRLNQKFPKIQFIMTTHSPLCVSGTADISGTKGAAYKVYSLLKDAKGDVQITERPIPRGLTADQILVDYFDLNTTLNVSLEKDFERLRSLLLSGKRSRKEEAEFKALKAKLSTSAPVLGESVQERELLSKIAHDTAKLTRYMRKHRDQVK